MNAMIIDDEPDGIGTLSRLLELHCPQVNLVATCTDPLRAQRVIRELSPEVVFLDVQMPAKSGLKILSELPAKAFEVIFVTAHSEYMLQALQYSAADYLLKPVDEDKLVEAVDRAMQRLQQGRQSMRSQVLLHNLCNAGSPGNMRLCISLLKGFVIVQLEDILYCQAERSYTVFHFNNGKSMISSKPLAEYDQLLGDADFFRVHKSYMINLQHVREYQRGEGGMAIMSNGDEIEISRRRKDLFLERIRVVCRY